MKKLIIFSSLLTLAIIFAVFISTGATSKSTGTRVSSREIKITKSESVCLDAGHGGDDQGANNQEITERDINLVVANDVKNNLENQGYQVFMTRTSNNQTLSNNDRYTYCNNKKATIMVSIHHNYFDDTSVDYDTVLYYKDSDQALANSILTATTKTLNVTNDSITSFNDGVLSESSMPAALSEAFFLTNDNEYALLKASDSTRLADEATGITNGIINYFNSLKPTTK